MELTYLKTFLAVCKHESISKAAKELYLNQTTVTNRVKELEKQLGAPLFERIRRGIRLTPQGQYFITYAEQSLSVMDEAVQHLDNHAQPVGIVKLASISNICSYVLPGWLGQLRKKFPQIEMRIETKHSRPIVDQVLKADIDIGLVRGPIEHNGLITHPICSEKIIPIVPADHPWFGKRIMAHELNGQKIIAYNRFSQTWEKLEQWLKNQNIAFSVSMNLDHDETSKLMLLNGHGITFLPSYSVKEELSTGRLGAFELDPPLNLSIQTFLIYNRRNPLSTPAQMVVDFFLEVSRLEGRLADES